MRAERDFFERWVVADYDVTRAERTVAAVTGRHTAGGRSGTQREGRHMITIAIDSLDLAPRVLERASAERANVLEFRV